MLDKSRHGEIVDLVQKRWKLGDRKMAEEIFNDVSRVLAKDGTISNESVQLLVDLARESAKVARPIKVAEVVDYSFLEKARRELGFAK